MQRGSYQFQPQPRGQSWARNIRVSSENLPNLAEDASITALCHWEGDTTGPPVPVVLTVEASLGVEAEPGSTVPFWFSAFAFPNNWDSDELSVAHSGHLRLEYSTGGEQRRWIDIVPGSYQLPPCRRVDVSARFYNSTEGTPLDYDLSVALVAGLHPSPAVPTYTGAHIYGGTPETATWYHAPGAYAFRTELLQPTGPDVQATVTRGVQPELALGPFPQWQPGVFDLAVIGSETDVVLTGGDEANVLAQDLIAW